MHTKRSFLFLKVEIEIGHEMVQLHRVRVMYVFGARYCVWETHLLDGGTTEHVQQHATIHTMNMTYILLSRTQHINIHIYTRSFTHKTNEPM